MDKGCLAKKLNIGDNHPKLPNTDFVEYFDLVLLKNPDVFMYPGFNGN